MMELTVESTKGHFEEPRPFASSGSFVKDKVVIVTGSVGNLGLATVRALEHGGARTVLVDRSKDRLTEIFPDLANSPRHMFAGGVELADDGSLKAMVDAIVERFGRIDGLVNTVGGYRGGKPVHETELADWDFLFGVNLRTTLLCSRAVVPQMMRQSSGRIVNVASAMACTEAPDMLLTARQRARCCA
jgi:Short-chain alcohol dehydrogenase of unknown specificity